MTNALLATLAIAGAAVGHLIMDHPIPFGVDTLNNSPLVDAKPGTSTSDYPCKQRQGVYDITAMNHMAVGEDQKLNFTGSASHGGGTCELAVTLDPEPKADSVFKLIQVFEGGCPITSDGNSGTDTFTFKIPQGFPNGRATLAWVWFNRIGNREIYMNCAPIEVTGGSDSHDLFDTLPNMYVINLPTSECESVDSMDVKIPFPGQFLLKADASQIVAPSGPSCAASAAAMTKGLNGYKSATSNNGAGTTNAASAPTASAAYTSAPPSSSSAAVQPSTSSTAAAAPTAYPTLTPSSGAGISDGGAAPTGTSGSGPAPGYGGSGDGGSGSAPSSGSGSASSGGTCSGGGLLCNGPTQFGLCNNGNVVWQPVAPGTTCQNGAIAKMKRGEYQARKRRHAVARRGDRIGKHAHAKAHVAV